MSADRSAATALEDTKILVRMRLSALWASMMLCYLYGDYFCLYVPGTVRHMLNGKMDELGPTTRGVVLAMALTMALPSAMIFLSRVLKADLCRWANIVLGVIEEVFTMLIARYART